MNRRNDLPGYDQWKTASPFDDEIDFVAEAQKWLADHSEEGEPHQDQEVIDHYYLIRGLVDIIEEEL